LFFFCSTNIEKAGCDDDDDDDDDDSNSQPIHVQLNAPFRHTGKNVIFIKDLHKFSSMIIFPFWTFPSSSRWIFKMNFLHSRLLPLTQSLLGERISAQIHETIPVCSFSLSCFESSRVCVWLLVLRTSALLPLFSQHYKYIFPSWETEAESISKRQTNTHTHKQTFLSLGALSEKKDISWLVRTLAWQSISQFRGAYLCTSISSFFHRFIRSWKVVQ